MVSTSGMIGEILETYLLGTSDIPFNEVLKKKAVINREIYILGEIEEELGPTIHELINFFNAVDNEANICPAQREPIKIYIDSNGGDFVASMTICESIRSSITPIHTCVIGVAYSGGIMICLAGHHRTAFKTSSFLFHEGSYCLSGTVVEARNRFNYYERQVTLLKKYILAYTKLTEEDYNSHIIKDYWMDAEEAQSLGFIDTIIEGI